MSLKRGWTIRRAIGVASSVLLVFASQAAAAPLRDLGPGTVWTDGDRYAVFFPPDEASRPRELLDERTNRRYALAAPQVAPASGFSTPVLCRFNGAAAGHVLWACDYGDPPFVLTELATGTNRPVPGLDELDASLSRFAFVDNVDVRAMGRRWLHLQAYSWSGLNANRWLDWHTGRLVTDPAGGPRRLFDLDDSRLSVPLCAPLRRRIEPYDGSGPDWVVPYLMRGGWLWEPSSFLRHRPIVIRRCGRSRPLVLHRCRRRCASSSFGAGYVTWLDTKPFSLFDRSPVSKDETQVFAYDLRKRRRLGFQGAFGEQPLTAVRHTRRRIYVDGYVSAGHIWVARLPARR